MVVVQFCCCRSEEEAKRRATNNGGFPSGGDESAKIPVAAPQANAISRTGVQDDEDSDRKAVQWIRNRSQNKLDDGGASPTLSDEAATAWAAEKSATKSKASPPRSPPRSSRWGQKRSSPPISPDRSPVKSDEAYFFQELDDLKFDTQHVFPPVSMSNDASLSKSMSSSPGKETLSPAISSDDDVDLISKERYVAAVKLLHRNLIEKEKAMTEEERNFLQDLLYSAIHEAPSVDQLSAVESATDTLDTDPLFLEETNLPPSPTKELQKRSPPRPYSKKPRVMSSVELARLAQMASTSDDDELGVEAMLSSPSDCSEVPISQREVDEMGVEATLSWPDNSEVPVEQQAEEMGTEMELGENVVLPEEEPELVADESMEVLMTIPSEDSAVVRFDGWSGLEEDHGGASSEGIPFRILGASPEDRPRVLTPFVIEALRGFMPSAVSENNFWLKFSLVRHGASLQTLLHKVRASTWTVIAVETMDGDVFGSFTGSPWRKRKTWFGSGEAFLWRLKHSRLALPEEIAKKPNFDNEMEVYPFTGHDDLVQYFTGGTLAVGGGDWADQESPYEGEPTGIGFMLDGDLEGGESSSCATFANPRLCQRTNTGTEFDIRNVEVWTVTPCNAVEEAQKLELHKMFVEENRVK